MESAWDRSYRISDPDPLDSIDDPDDMTHD